MIKLNNKNITYVALADSSNSLKAPKEIWYADSSNSVKLVYRRKDALIEGEDYEKYHWLVAEIPIRTSMQSLPINSANFSFTVIFGQEANITILKGKTHEYYVYDNNMQKIRVWGYNGIGNVYQGDVLSNTMIIESTSAELLINNIAIPQYSYPIKYLMFSSSSNSPNDTTLRVSKIYVNGIERYIPCKLLKPVPKWLDANGIRRQIGECGMIDLVSGKFYGNVNSVGTFTVENYYERKEWIVGDGTAYIDTLHLANEGLDWETHVSNLSFKKYFVWNRVINGECPAIALYHSVLYNGKVRVQNNYTNSIELQNQTNYDYIVTTNSNGAVINGVQHIGQSASENISNKSIKLFYCDIDELSKTNTVIVNGGNSQDVCCAYFRFLDSNRDYIQNLIPCTLTMDLPASMDANNIARTKGTSGMWDLVSDRFYGNVASSGTFKAVNLAEGVDYEVHQWLRAGVDTIATMCILPVDSNVIEFKSKRIRGRNFHYFHTDGDYVYFCASGLQKAIYNYNTSATIYYSSLVALGEEVIISCNDNKILMGNDELPIYGYPITSVRISVANSEGMETLTSSITVDGIERYIPVKLLKSIPSKYDANGIARQAGECGMYDTVNDVFYGNVASDGTFSVSDDN